MVICTPNRRYGSPRIFADPSHLHIYERLELVRMVEDAGFRVEESVTIFPPPATRPGERQAGGSLMAVVLPPALVQGRGSHLLLRARRNGV